MELLRGIYSLIAEYQTISGGGWLHDISQVCFQFKGLTLLEFFCESNRCPFKPGHLASNRCAIIASRDKILLFPEGQIAQNPPPTYYNSAHTCES